MADTRFSVDRGFYREAFVCTVTTQTPGATLVYTTDGTLPGARNGVAFQAASPESAPELKLEIGTTTTLRVMAMKKNMEPSNIDTQTYVFPDDILAQDGEGHLMPKACDGDMPDPTGPWTPKSHSMPTRRFARRSLISTDSPPFHRDGF